MPNKKRKTQIPGVSVSVPLQADTYAEVLSGGCLSVALPQEIVPSVVAKFNKKSEEQGFPERL